MAARLASEGQNWNCKAVSGKVLDFDSVTSRKSAGIRGMAAVLIGGVVPVAAIVNFFGGSFALQNSLGIGLGEIAGGAGKAVFCSSVGLDQP